MRQSLTIMATICQAYAATFLLLTALFFESEVKLRLVSAYLLINRNFNLFECDLSLMPAEIEALYSRHGDHKLLISLKIVQSGITHPSD